MGQTPTKTEDRSMTRREKALLVGKILVFFLLVVFINQIGAWLADLITFQMWPRHELMAVYLLLTSAILYTLLLSVPFLPARFIER